MWKMNIWVGKPDKKKLPCLAQMIYAKDINNQNNLMRQSILYICK